jgi:hypothetical protein
MAFAITAWKAEPKPLDQAVIKRFDTTIEIHMTGLVADVDADIGDIAAGAFWVDAEANVTHGAKATALKSYIASLYPKCSSVTYKSENLDTSFIRVLAGPALAGEFSASQNATTKLPEIAFAAGAGPTAWKLIIDCKLKAGEWPLAQTSYGSDI